MSDCKGFTLLNQHAYSVYCSSAQEQECVRRPLRCDYCRLDVPMQDFSEHEQVCGSRTDKCHLCGRYVKLMDLDDHMKYCGQEVEKPSTTPPTKSAPPQQALQRMRETGGYRENVLEHIIPTNVHPNYSGISTYRHTDKKVSFVKLCAALLQRPIPVHTYVATLSL